MTETDLSTKAGGTEAQGAEPGVAEHKRILMVEGDGFTRLVLLLRLRLAGFGVEFTSNGILGLGKLRSCNPDILLVELKLCGMSGLELIRAARAEPTFGKRPIYVFTHASKMNRATRKEVGLLATEVFDKGSITREDLVQIFATKLLSREPAVKDSPSGAPAQATPPPPELNEVVLSVAIDELIAGVREQFEAFAKDVEPRVASGGELLSRLSSLASCAKAARLHNLARQASAIERFLSELSRREEGCTDAAMANLRRGVEVMAGIPFTASDPQPGATRFNVVFIDEAPYSNRAMDEALLNAEFEPACFEDPARAREYLASNRTDLILANVVLPEGHRLSVADVRRLPFHARTPVLFGPESHLTVPMRDELPISAPRLDRAPVLLAEMVLRALNEVQGKGIAATVAATPTPVTPVQDSIQTASPLALPAEDGFELFAAGPRRPASAATEASVQPAPVHSGAVNQGHAFKHLFAEAGIPNEPILRADMTADSEAHSQARMEAVSADSGQIDEPAAEAFAPGDSQVEAPEPVQPEPTVEDQAAAVDWVAAAATDAGQTIAPMNTSADFDQSQAASIQETGESTQNDGPVMNNKLRIAPEDYLQRDGIQSAETPVENPNRREDLAARVCAAEMSLYHAQAELEQRNKEIEELQAQLAAGNGQAQAQPGEPSEAEQKAQARCAELEQEVSALRQAIEGMSGALPEPQPVSVDAAARLEELEQRLNQNTAELQGKLDAATEASKETETALQKAEERCARLEQELSSARRANTELANKSAKDQKLNAEESGEPSASPADLEHQVRQGVAALAHATAELAQERGERQRSQQLAADLNSRLQALHIDLSRTLQTQGESLSRICTLEQQQRQTREAFDRCTADLEQQQAERGTLETQLQKAKEVNAQLRKDLSFFDQANRKFDGSRQELQTKLEATFGAARDHEARLQQEKEERQRLAQSLEDAQRHLQDQTRKREALEQQLKAAQDSLQDRETKLQKEAAERQRLNDTLDSVQLGTPGVPERELEFSKLQTALQLEQIERKRQESQLARTRQSALDSALAVRALRTTLRRQIRGPVENVIHSARHLLELEMGEDQKKLAEAVLQDVLLVQTRLREAGPAHGDSSEPSVTPTPAST